MAENVTITKEQLKAIIDGCEGVTLGPWEAKTQEEWDQGFKFFAGKQGAFTFPIDMEPLDVAHVSRLDPATVKAMATLALQSLDREGGLESLPVRWIDEGDLQVPYVSLWAAQVALASQPPEAGQEPRQEAVAWIMEATNGLPLHKRGTTADPETAKYWASTGTVTPLYANPSPQPSVPTMVVTDAARDVLAERKRQVEAEGWTPGHDDQHLDGEIARAAGLYALIAGSDRTTYRNAVQGYGLNDFAAAAMRLWPWDVSWFKPTNRRRDLVKAGALILAEIERLDRIAALGKE